MIVLGLYNAECGPRYNAVFAGGGRYFSNWNLCLKVPKGWVGQNSKNRKVLWYFSNLISWKIDKNSEKIPFFIKTRKIFKIFVKKFQYRHEHFWDYKFSNFFSHKNANFPNFEAYFLGVGGVLGWISKSTLVIFEVVLGVGGSLGWKIEKVHRFNFEKYRPPCPILANLVSFERSKCPLPP